MKVGLKVRASGVLTPIYALIAEQTESISRWDRFFKLKKKSPPARMMGKGRLCVMGLCGVGESHAPDAFAAVLNQTTDTHLSATRINNDGIMQGTALPSTPPVWVATNFAPQSWCKRKEFLSTPPVWVATRQHRYCDGGKSVSIHATRVGGDAQTVQEMAQQRGFLSTPPVWVATP